MTRFLVTGGAGFLGSQVARALLGEGHAVRVLDDFSLGTEALAPVLDGIELIEGDVRDPRDVTPALADVDVIIHLAAFRTIKSCEDPLLAHEVNTTATLVLLDRARLAGVKRFVYASTAAVYGNAIVFPQKETELPNPISPYAVGKLAAETYCGLFARTTLMETVSLRYFNIYGPGQNPLSKYSGVVTAFLSALQAGGPCQIFGDGLRGRDFIYIDDAVQATLAATLRPAINGRVINVGSGSCHTIIDVARMLSRLMGSDLEPAHLPPRSGQLDRSHADISLMKELLGVEPQVDFEEGLARTVSWFREKE